MGKTSGHVGGLSGWVPSAGLALLAVLAACGERKAEVEFAIEGQFGRAPKIYQRNCSVCHGLEGFGDGKAAYLVHPRPRDFSYGKFLMVSTDNRVPTDDDLFRTISRGMPGSAMPSWERLPEEDRLNLVRYIRALTHRGKVLRLMGDTRGPVAAGDDEEPASEPLPRQKAEETATYLLEVGQPLDLPAATEPSENDSQAGRKIYVDTCAKCHGQEGKGDGSEVMEDDLGFRAFPRDFTKGVFKGGVEPDQLAYRILGGMPGTAMPSTDFRTGEDLWATIHYVRSLIEPGAQERVEQRRRELRTTRILQPLPMDPSDASWERVQPAFVALLPLWWRDERVEGVDVRAVHDGENLAIHLTWNDPTENAHQLHITAFGDGAAVQLSNDEDPPFFGMGDVAGTVNIWHWKSTWEGNRPNFPDISQAYPRALMDFDMSVKKIQPSQGPHLASKIEERDPTFYSGWGAGNLLSRPDRPGAAEDLNARGLGTVHSQALRGQNVHGSGVWKEGVWRAMFLRALSASESGDINFRPGESVRIAFAIWDGQAGDRDGQKSVTIWHDLTLEE